MAINFPTSLDSLTNPTVSEKTNNPSHVSQHANANDILEALEAKVGADSSAVVSSIDYIINNNLLKLDQTTPQSIINGSPIIEGIQFDITPSTSNVAEGLLRWNSTDGTLDLGMSGGDITMQIGQEIFAKVRNESGYETISNGQPVYISGRTGVFPEVQKSRSDAESTSCVLGLATQDIASPGFGYITTYGYVRGIKTDYTGNGNWGTTWNLNDKLYVSKTVAGQLTNVEPTAPHHSDVVATVAVVGGAGVGSLFVNINRHASLQALTDIDGTALSTTGQILVWNNTAGYFDFTSNILTEYVPYTGGNANVDLGVHNFTVDTNSLFVNSATHRVGVGTTSPTSTLHNAGSLTVAYRAITSARTLDATDYLIDCTSGTFSVTLPTAVGCAGRTYVIKNTDNGVITVDTTSSQTIDGALTVVLSVPYESVTVVSNGTNWLVI